MLNGKLWKPATMLACVAMALTACGGANGAAGTEEFPTETIEMIVPFAPGGATDAAARLLAEEMKESIGQEVVVVNREGASGVLGTTEVANGKADGYTVLFTPDGPLLRTAIEQTPFQIQDFKTVSTLTESAYVVLVNRDSPWKSVDDIKDAGKTVRYGVSGIGTQPHVVSAGLLEALGVEATSVPYDGSAPAMQALLGNQIELTVAEPQIAEQYVTRGDLRALAVTSSERLDVFPDVPTFDESGYEDAAFTVTFGLLAPQETPDERVDVLESAVSEAMESDAMTAFIDNNYLLRFENGDWLSYVNDKTQRYGDAVERLGLIK